MTYHRLAAAVAMAGLILAGCDQKAPETPEAPQSQASKPQPGLETPAQKASYGIGLNMGQSLMQEGLTDLDAQAVAMGIDDAVGKKKQRVSDEELLQAFAFLQNRVKEQQAIQSAAAAKAGKEFLEANAKKEGVITTQSGLQYKILKAGEGPLAKVDDVVTVHYEGRLADGTVFDSSIQRGSPIDLPVNGVIPGWIEALQLMNVGEKVELYIPSELAYGEQSPTPAIPANSVLVFDLELLGIKDPEAVPAAPAAPAAPEKQ